jgi:hypothetical protein
MFRKFKRRLKGQLRNLKGFPARLVAYLPLIWEDRDFDYGYVLSLMFFKLRRLRKHILDHNIIVRAEEVAAEIAHAEDLYNRYLEYDGVSPDEEQQLWNEFFDYVRDHIRGWWD